MGRVTTALPVTMANVKAAYGATGTRTLREFVAGGSYANSNTAGYNGFVANTGTIDLLDFRGATNLNVTFSGSNTVFKVNAWDINYGNQPSQASARIDVYANGIIRLLGSSDTYQGGAEYTPNVNGGLGGNMSNSWLQRGGSDSDANVAGNFEVLFVKSGASSANPTNNNVWTRCNVTRSQSISSSATGGSDNDDLIMRMKFRRFDTGAELANVYVELQTSATSLSGEFP